MIKIILLVLIAIILYLLIYKVDSNKCSSNNCSLSKCSCEENKINTTELSNISSQVSSNKIEFNYDVNTKINNNDSIVNNMKSWYPNRWIESINDNNEYIYAENNTNEIYESKLIVDKPKQATIYDGEPIRFIYDDLLALEN
jgi:hypothetical protein